MSSKFCADTVMGTVLDIVDSVKEKYKMPEKQFDDITDFFKALVDARLDLSEKVTVMEHFLRIWSEDPKALGHILGVLIPVRNMLGYVDWNITHFVDSMFPQAYISQIYREFGKYINKLQRPLKQATIYAGLTDDELLAITGLKHRGVLFDPHAQSDKEVYEFLAASSAKLGGQLRFYSKPNPIAERARAFARGLGAKTMVTFDTGNKEQMLARQCPDTKGVSISFRKGGTLGESVNNNERDNWCSVGR